MTRTRGILILVLAVVQGLPAQREDWQRDRRDHEWRLIVDGMTAAERRAFRRLTIVEKEKAIVELVEARRAEREQAFVETLATDVQLELSALPDKERQLRLLHLKLARKLDTLIDDALEIGVLDADSATRARALTEPETKAQRILELQKEIFVQIHRHLIEGLSPHDRAEVLALPPERFFAHAVVNDMRMRHHFTHRAINELRRSGRDGIERFLEALSSGDLKWAERRLFRDGGLTAYEALDAAGRRRFAEDLRRTHFFRELQRPMPPRRRVIIPPDLFETLSPEEQEAYLTMPASARDAFTQRRFPEWWKIHGHRAAPARPRVRDFIEGWRKLPEPEKRRLLDRPLIEGLQEVLGPPPGDPGRRPR